MGRDWYWGSGAKPWKRASSERDSAPSGCINSVFQLFDFHHFHFPLYHQTSSTTTGSSSTFKPDSFLTPYTIPTSTTIKGTEAPRKSLESEEDGSASASLTSTSKEEESLSIPIGIQIKTRTKHGAQNNETFSDISSSPGTKTPTLVARLMGLDLLPVQSHSPSYSAGRRSLFLHRNSFDGDMRGTRSLPETPRISSGRRLVDVDYHHQHQQQQQRGRRLSLQINKDNKSADEEQFMVRLSSLKKKTELKHNNKNEDHDHENRSPAGQYARQIVKQVKESVSRKAGLDITNTVRSREQSREELVSQLKSRKFSRALTKVADDHYSSSPKLRLLDSKSKLDHNPQPSKQSSSPETNIRVFPKPKLLAVEEEPAKEQQQKPPKAASKSKKGSNVEKFGSRLKKPQQTSDIIRNKQEEPFVRPSNIPDKKCRKTPLSNDLLTVPTLLPVKKDPSSSPTKVPQKQVVDAQIPQLNSQFSSCFSQTYNKQEATHLPSSRDKNGANRRNDAAATTKVIATTTNRRNDAAATTTVIATTTSTAAATTGDEEAEYEYIGRILRRTGLDKDTPVSSITSWFSPSHPLDPSIFYHLEHFTICSTTINNCNNSNNKTDSSRLRHRCKRKLLFHLVDEILSEILKHYFNTKPWVISMMRHYYYYDQYYCSHMVGSELIDTLCSKIRSFPQADCRVLEDIDALIDSDLPEIKAHQHQQQQQSVTAYEEEGEGIVTEIEKYILEALLRETAVEFWFTSLTISKV